MKLTTSALVGMRAIETWLRKHFRLPARPYKWLLELTLECNSRCGSCSIWKTPARIKRQQLTLSEIEALFLGNGRDLVWLALSGGEVTVYDDFVAVIALAKRYCKGLRLVTFTTNGLLPEKALCCARALRDAGFDSFVTISLDGDAETHDRIRGVRGNHELAWQTYHLLQSNGIDVHFGITLSANNVDFIERRYAELRDKIKAVTFLHDQGIYAQANVLDDAAIARSLAVIDSAYRVTNIGDLLERCYVRLARRFVAGGRNSNVVPCAVGRGALHIRSDGATLPCMFMPELGSVREGTRLRDMVNSKRGAEMLQRIDAGDCPHCWMNCYAPHSILLNPVTAIAQALRRPIASPLVVQPALPHQRIPPVRRHSAATSIGAPEAVALRRSLPIAGSWRNRN